MKITTIYLLLLGLIFCSCKSESEFDKIFMNGKVMKAPFSLLNGIQMDELKVDSFSKDGTPYVFHLKEVMKLGRWDNVEHTTYIDSIIFFDQPNYTYEWQNDSTWGLYNISVVDYKYRSPISKKDPMDHSYNHQDKIFFRRFKPNTWYLIDFIPDKIGLKRMAFMHVDAAMNFRFYELKS